MGSTAAECIATELAHSSGSAAPHLVVPPGACDCHMHIYSDDFAPSPHWKRVPPHAPVDAYRCLQRRLGTTRTVIVQPSTYGIDNRCTLAALKALGPSTRAVVVVDTDVTADTLHQMDRLGVRGVRVNFVTPQSWGETTKERLVATAERICALGWHLQLFALSEQIAALESTLRALPVPLVIDHLARVPQPAWQQEPGYLAVRRLIEQGNTWIKLSGAYMDTLSGPPAYADVSGLARSLVAAAPERMVWGTDWPHPTARITPDDAVLLDLLLAWADDDAIRRRILVDNPERLYGFSNENEGTP